LNEPPKPGEGYSTEVINSFSWGEDGSMWSKIPLPRDAHVQHIRFVGEQCYLEIRRTTSNRVLTFRGPATFIRGLESGRAIGPLKDEELWTELEEMAEPPPSEMI
jgi:hypothetical protein